MLYSMFNRRKGQKKTTNFTTVKRAQSPPSPASFVSPEIVDIHEKVSVDAHAHAQSNGFNSSRASTPRVQLDLDHHSMSISDWFPQGMLGSEIRSPPERNVSLPGGSGGSGHGHGTVSSSRNASRTREISPPSPVDDVIVIKPTKPEPEQAEPFTITSVMDADAHSTQSITSTSDGTPSRKPTPIRIPDNPAAAKVQVQHPASEGVSASQTSNLALPGSNVSTRPPTPGSAYTEEISSAISGTTLARALVANSFIFTADTRASRYRNGVTRQDSAILPRGDHALMHSPSDRRASSSTDIHSPERPPSVPPVPPLPPSADTCGSLDSAGSAGRIRKNSVAAPESRRGSAEFSHALEVLRGHKDQPSAVPPISPITEAPSPAPSVPNTPSIWDGVSHTSNRSSQKPPSIRCSVHTKDDDVVPPSPLVEQEHVSTEPPASSTVSSDSGPSERVAHRRSKFMLDLTVEGATFSSPQPLPALPTTTTGSSYSANSFEKQGTSTAGTSLKTSVSGSNAKSPSVTRSRSDSGLRNYNAPYRPVVLLPIGERPRSVQVPHSPISSPVSTRTPSDTDLRARMYLGAGVPISATARHIGETPVDSPDLLDFMFPVAPTNLTYERSGSHLAPLAISPQDQQSSLRNSSVESLIAGSASRQTFPETPYAFSPLWSAGVASPIPPPPARPGMEHARSLPRTNRGGVLMRFTQRNPLSRSTSFGGASPPRHPPLSTEIIQRKSSESDPGTTGSSEYSHEQPQARLSRIEESRSPSNPPSHSPSPEPSLASGRSGRAPSDGAHTREGGCTSASFLHASSARGSMAMAESRSPLRSPLPPLPVPAARTPPTTPLPAVPAIEYPLGSPPPFYAPSEEPSSTIATLEVRLQAETDNGVPERLSMPPVRAASPQLSSLLPRKRALSPLPSPPPSGVPSPQPPSPRSVVGTQQTPDHAPPSYVDDMRRPSPPDTPPSRLTAILVSNRAVTPDLGTPTTTSKRTPRTRPPLPLGPRKPSNSTASSLFSGRSRNGSVSSTTNLSSHHPMRRPSAATLSASLPRFQRTAAKFKGLTMEQAQWTFTSQQLQEVVSSAIKQTVDPSAIRLLPLDTLNHGVADEIHRLEALSAELKNEYRLNARRRRMLMSSLTSTMDSLEHPDTPAIYRMLDELSDLDETLDQLAEELYNATDQLSQLNLLREMHKSSALAMALRKLNTKVVQQIAESQKLREQMAALEAERDDAWKQAQEIAREFDDMTDKTAAPAREESVSRRSSRVLVARKNSTRKAELRSSLHTRSQRSSTSDAHRNSTAGSPGVRSAPIEEIPPVPRLPIRTPLGIMTDVPSGHSTDLMSDSASSGLRALTEAQRELCEILGISLEELRPSRPQSMSTFEGRGVSPRKRRNSEVLATKQRTPGSAQATFRIS
ncbi:hypothetical protein BKA93DRAFT_357341 [Sparassis latifolia]